MASKPALPNLTSLRLLAALYVFCFHFVKGVPIASIGNTGVSLFFVLSGFILAYNHPAVTDRPRFFAARFARIYPLYLFSLLLELPQFLYSHRHASLSSFAGLPLAVLLLQAWVPPLNGTLNPAAWTLSVEAFFYLSFPFLLPAVAKQRHLWRLWCVLLALALVLPACIGFFFLIPRFADHAQAMHVFLNLPLLRLGEFVMGMFLGLRFLEKRPTVTGWHMLAGVAFLVGCTACARQIPWTERELIQNGLLAVPYGVVIYLLAGWNSRWFAHPTLQLGGEISYGIYLLQFPVVSVLHRFLHADDAVHSALYFFATCAAAYVCYIFIEKPSRYWVLDRFGYRHRGKAIPTPGLQV